MNIFTKIHGHISMCFHLVTSRSASHMNLAAILKFPLAILKMKKKLRWLARKYLKERFDEHNLKVSCLYPEVHGRLKKQTFPAPLYCYFSFFNLRNISAPAVNC